MYTLAHWTGNSYLEPNSCSLVFWNKQQHTLSGCWTEWGGSEGFGGVHISEMQDRLSYHVILNTLIHRNCYGTHMSTQVGGNDMRNENRDFWVTI